jgi:hypothetical protein
MGSTKAFTAGDNAYNEKINKIDQLGAEETTAALKELQEDKYIEESYFILTDLIRLTKK